MTPAEKAINFYPADTDRLTDDAVQKEKDERTRKIGVEGENIWPAVSPLSSPLCIETSKSEAAVVKMLDEYR